MRLCILLAFSLSGTHAFAGYNDSVLPSISRPEKYWAVLHPFKVSKAFRITKHVRKEVEELLQTGQADTLRHGGKTDAFRHAYWMALLTSEIGEKSARKLGLAHEKGNYISHKKGKMEDGYYQDATACDMDLYNNEAGISIAKENPNADWKEYKMRILEAIQNGKMRIFKTNKYGQFCDCEGRTIVIPALNNRTWKMPFCLINSNE